MRPPSLRALIGIGFPLLAAAGVAAWAINDSPRRDQPSVIESPAPTPSMAEPAGESKPAEFWPLGLDQLVGRYTFAQVASPGGLWELSYHPGGPRQSRQVSIHEVPAALRDRLLNTEIIISNLQSPRTRDVQERESPTKRGRLRFYDESAAGHLVVRGSPGIGASPEAMDYEGPVIFSLMHRSHSNPSVGGWQYARDREEQTWGAATLDYAQLQASIPAPGPNAEEDVTVIANARVLRSGQEIFAYIYWQEQGPDGERVFYGSIRLRREKPHPEGEPAQQQ